MRAHEPIANLPTTLAPPWCACLPVPVCPYANTVQLNPSSVSATMGSICAYVYLRRVGAEHAVERVRLDAACAAPVVAPGFHRRRRSRAKTRRDRSRARAWPRRSRAATGSRSPRPRRWRLARRRSGVCGSGGVGHGRAERGRSVSDVSRCRARRNGKRRPRGNRVTRTGIARRL